MDSFGLGTKNGNGFQLACRQYFFLFPTGNYRRGGLSSFPIESLGKKSVDFTIGTDRAEKDATACDPAEFLETVLNFQSGEINSDLDRLLGHVEKES